MLRLRLSTRGALKVVRRQSLGVRAIGGSPRSAADNGAFFVEKDAPSDNVSTEEAAAHTQRIESEYKMSNLQRAIQQAVDVGEYAEGIETAKEALQVSEAEFGPSSPVTASVHNNIALLQKKLGRWEEAEKSYKTAITLYESAYGPFHSSSITAFANLGVMLREKAELASSAAGEGPGSPEAEADAEAARREGLERALGYSEEALLRRKRVEKDERSAMVGLALMNVASAHRALGSFRLALRALDDARIHVLATLPPTHPYVATYHNSRGLVLKGLGRMAEAEKEYGTALRLREAALSPSHGDVLVVLHNLAELEAARGDAAKATAMRQDILRRREQAAMQTKGASRYVEEESTEEDSDDGQARMRSARSRIEK